MVEFPQAEAQVAEYPNELLVDPDKANKAVFVSFVKGIFASPSMVQSFDAFDERYQKDKAAYVQFMFDSVMRIGGFRPNIAGPQLDTSFVHGPQNANSNAMAVVTSPLNDGRPLSSAEILAAYVNNPRPSRLDVERAKPNSAGPATKLHTIYEVLDAEGLGMPTLQLYSRVAPWLFTINERKQMLWDGDFRPYGRAVVASIKAGERRQHEVYGTGGVEDLHLLGVSIPQKAIGAAQYILENHPEYNVKSITLMNLPLNQGPAQALHSYATRRMVNDASDLLIPEGFVMRQEPALRRDIEPKGVEFGLYPRVARAMLDLSVTVGLTRSTQSTMEAFERFQELGITTTLANSLNESMAEGSEAYIPQDSDNFHFMQLVGVEGKKVGMAAGEHAGAVAVVAAQGIRNSLPR